jgi:hypothetical protein
MEGVPGNWKQLLLLLCAVNGLDRLHVLFAHKGNVNDSLNTGTAVQQIADGVICVWQC